MGLFNRADGLENTSYFDITGLDSPGSLLSQLGFRQKIDMALRDLDFNSASSPAMAVYCVAGLTCMTFG